MLPFPLEQYIGFVGYGDVYPITLGGKIFTFFVLIIGVGVITVPAGLVAGSRDAVEKRIVSV